MPGRIEEAVRYSDAAQRVIGNGRHQVPFGIEGWLAVRTWSSASPNGRSRCAARSSHAVATPMDSPGHPWSSR